MELWSDPKSPPCHAGSLFFTYFSSAIHQGAVGSNWTHVLAKLAGAFPGFRWRETFGKNKQKQNKTLNITP